MNVRIEALKSVEILAVLSESGLLEIAGSARVRTFDAGVKLFDEGEPGRSLHVVQRGFVEIIGHGESGEKVSLVTYGPGQSFGELALIDPGPRSAAAVALDHTDTIEVGSDAFERAIAIDADAPRRMLGVLARSLTMAKEQVINQNRILDQKVRERTAQLGETQLEVIRRLGRAAEFRDDHTGIHISRMSRLCRVLASAAGFEEGVCELLLNAAPMHDVGKIGIPDHILLKPGKLDPDEWAIMKTHTTIGGELLAGSTSDVMRLAHEIALAHHERWDGAGYPNGLTGADIPVMARIASVCDVFDALISDRPYKRAWSVEDAMSLIRNEAGKQFDPHLASLFLGVEREVRVILEAAQESADANGVAEFDGRATR